MGLQHLLDRSAATEPFRTAVRQFISDGRTSSRLVFDNRCPTVKVERTVAKILEAYPTLSIDQVEIEARSGCEYFRGTAIITTAEATSRVRFEWNCRWKAEQLGWFDYFGFPDQTRAAREFGHDCFMTWEEEPIATSTAA